MRRETDPMPVAASELNGASARKTGRHNDGCPGQGLNRVKENEDVPRRIECLGEAFVLRAIQVLHYHDCRTAHFPPDGKHRAKGMIEGDSGIFRSAELLREAGRRNDSPDGGASAVPFAKLRAGGSIQLRTL